MRVTRLIPMCLLIGLSLCISQDRLGYMAALNPLKLLLAYISGDIFLTHAAWTLWFASRVSSSWDLG